MENKSHDQDSVVIKIRSSIVRLPGRPPVMLDIDLAKLYETETKRINETVKRNPERFPKDFMFQLTEQETKNLRSQFATANSGEDELRAQSVTAETNMRRNNPYAFTREGANMLSAVLKTPIAVERSVQIMRAFSAMEEEASSSRRSGTHDVKLEKIRIHEIDAMVKCAKTADKKLEGKASLVLLGHLSGMDVSGLIAELESIKVQKGVTDIDLMVQRFVSDKCDVGEQKFEKASVMYDAFSQYYAGNAPKPVRYIPSQKRFGASLGKMFDKAKLGGVYKYFGISLRTVKKIAVF